MELWNIFYVETVIDPQQQRDKLVCPVNVGPVYGAKLDDVCFIHVAASAFSDSHGLLAIRVVIAKLDHQINGIETVVARGPLRNFFTRISERASDKFLSSIKR